ncbi:MAG: hypothetical protein K6E40_13170 [Desulfovibrio sp.]|nr:hypothetical protein [Desulfovibrio sp.]
MAQAWRFPFHFLPFIVVPQEAVPSTFFIPRRRSDQPRAMDDPLAEVGEASGGQGREILLDPW